MPTYAVAANAFLPFQTILDALGITWAVQALSGVQIALDSGHLPEREFGDADLERLGVLVPWHLQGMDSHSGGDAFEVRNEPRQVKHRADVGHDQAEGSRGYRGVESGFEFKRTLDRRNRVRNRSGKRLGIFRWSHAAAGAHEQRVVVLLPQPVDGPAHRGLGHPEAGRRRGDASFAHYRVEGAQQVEIKGVDIQASSFLGILHMAIMHWTQIARGLIVAARRSSTEAAARNESEEPR